jgi:taurine dioxygenase
MAKTNRYIEIKPMAGALGAEVFGADLSRPLEDAAFAEIKQAFADHLVLMFREQRLTPEQHLAFSRGFGPLTRSPYVKHMDEYPDIIAVLKEADEVKISTFGNAWHSDFSFLEEPPMGSALYAREIPDHGGDTLFANMYAAYESLSE